MSVSSSLLLPIVVCLLLLYISNAMAVSSNISFYVRGALGQEVYFPKKITGVFYLAQGVGISTFIGGSELTRELVHVLALALDTQDFIDSITGTILAC